MNFLKRTWAEIDLDALEYNFGIFRKMSNGKLTAVVKADAYGHGASVVAPILESSGADEFAVSNIEEAIEIRRAGVKKPILILGYTPTHYTKDLIEYGIIQTVYSLSYAVALSDSAEKIGGKVLCHLKIDSGMSRLGFDCRDSSIKGIAEMESVCGLNGLEILGAFTHFATADRDGDEDEVYTNGQYERFISACDKLERDGFILKEKHCCNSAGFLLHQDKHLSNSRLGIILYGLTPSSNLNLSLPLKPVMSFKSTVSFIKKIRKGDAVSYGRKFTAQNDMTVATVTAGYADGYQRALSCKGYVLINGKKAKILGNVCMDQMIVDISNIDNVTEGNEVILFGDGLPVEEVASICNTINYELICGVSRRVPRVYKQNGKEFCVVDYIMDR